MRRSQNQSWLGAAEPAEWKAESRIALSVARMSTATCCSRLLSGSDQGTTQLDARCAGIIKPIIAQCRGSEEKREGAS